MEKSKMMKQYEQETGKKSIKYIMVHMSVDGYDHGKLVHDEEYVAWLEAKASAYDRPMSGGKKTLKEWATFLGIEWLEDQPSWRPVSEKLPSVEKDGDAVIAKLKDADEGLVQFDVVSTVWFIDNYESWYTHWLPIPPAPDTVSDGWEEVKK